jgi:hypothetical protein
MGIAFAGSKIHANKLKDKRIDGRAKPIILADDFDEATITSRGSAWINSQQARSQQQRRYFGKRRVIREQSKLASPWIVPDTQG